MTYDFSTRLDKLGTRMKDLNNNTLTYTRSATILTITNFTPEKIDVASLAMYGLTIITDKMIDVIFDSADLSTLSPPEPKVGDVVVIGTRTYNVMGLGPSAAEAQCFEYTTTSRARVRVHLRQTI